MKIYTGKGDNLKTELIGKKEVYKDSTRVEAYGAIDELNTVLGISRAVAGDNEIKKAIYDKQQKLLRLASILADPDNKLQLAFSGEDIREIEHEIDKISNFIPQERGFVIPGECAASSHLHFARAVARRAERNLVTLAVIEGVDENVLIYMNRLSDYLFVMAQWTLFRQTVQRIVLKVLGRYHGSGDRKEEPIMPLNLDLAKKILIKAEEKAKEIGVPMTIAIVDEGGNTVALHKMDGALLASLDIAQSKAYSACSLRMSTEELSKISGSGQPLFGIDNTNQGRIVIFGGGVPIYLEEKVVGGLGVSGGSVEEDILVAEFALGHI
jgi:cob(I)alamin adenosyltransferase